VLTASAETIAADLRQYGEDATADWLLACTDEELVRVCSVGEWLLYHGPSTRSGSMLIAKALSLAAVYVREGAPRDLARSRRRRLDSRPDRDDGRRPDHVLASGVPYAYGVGDDARAFWEEGGSQAAATLDRS
jgi:hypothetical protein